MKGDHERAYFQNVTNQTNSMLMNDDIKFDAAFKTTNANGSAAYGGENTKPGASAATNPVPGLPANTAYIVRDPETDEPPLFASTKQI